MCILLFEETSFLDIWLKSIDIVGFGQQCCRGSTKLDHLTLFSTSDSKLDNEFFSAYSVPESN